MVVAMRQSDYLDRKEKKRKLSEILPKFTFISVSFRRVIVYGWRVLSHQLWINSKCLI